MHYWINLYDKKGQVTVYEDAILPGLVPDNVVDMMVDSFVDRELDLCRLCDVKGCRCHVIEIPTGRKLCPVLFKDAFNPAWEVEDIV